MLFNKTTSLQTSVGKWTKLPWWWHSVKNRISLYTLKLSSGQDHLSSWDYEETTDLPAGLSYNSHAPNLKTKYKHTKSQNASLHQSSPPLTYIDIGRWCGSLIVTSYGHSAPPGTVDAATHHIINNKRMSPISLFYSDLWSWRDN